MKFPIRLPSLRNYRKVQHTKKDAKQTRWQQLYRLPVIRYLRSLRWTPIPMSIGFALIAYQQYRHIRRRESKKCNEVEFEKLLAHDWEIKCYRMLPLKSLSRAWGWVNRLELPVWARKPILSVYVRSFGCDLSEAEEEDLKHYKNLSEFFRRPIKADVRPIDSRDCVVSPADGKVLHYGLVTNDRLEQVKGISYSLQAFLGPNTWSSFRLEEIPGNTYQEKILHNPGENVLYHCIIYLAPGDYHRFHSPVEWKVHFRRHFSGELFSVSPGVARWIAGLFSLNERAVYVGSWRHGLFSLTAVGATNVGSIRVSFDKDLMTNVKGWKKGTHHEHRFDANDAKGIQMEKGQFFGEFNLGSTIVLIFEAPKNYTFNLAPEQKIKVGQSLNHCQEHNSYTS